MNKRGQLTQPMEFRRHRCADSSEIVLCRARVFCICREGLVCSSHCLYCDFEAQLSPLTRSGDFPAQVGSYIGTLCALMSLSLHFQASALSFPNQSRKIRTLQNVWGPKNLSGSGHSRSVWKSHLDHRRYVLDCLDCLKCG